MAGTQSLLPVVLFFFGVEEFQKRMGHISVTPFIYIIALSADVF